MKFLRILLILGLMTAGAAEGNTEGARSPLPVATHAHSLYLPIVHNELQVEPDNYDCGHVQGIPESECEALKALYWATQGATRWTNSSHWLENYTPCNNWWGVHCKDGHVVSLTFSTTEQEYLVFGNGLTGPLPPEIALLTELKALHLERNEITHLPRALSALTQLEELNLREYRPTGLEVIGELASLQKLGLKELGLNELPPWVTDLTQLRWLFLEENNLQALPPRIGALTRLERLGTDAHRLPTELGSLSNLRYLAIHFSALDELPSSIGNLAQLEVLDLIEVRQLTGLPPETGNLGNLHTLSLLNHGLEQLPAEIGRLSRLRHLRLINGPLRALPPEIVHLDALETLDVSFNYLEISEPEIIAWLDAHDPDWRERQW